MIETSTAKQKAGSFFDAFVIAFLTFDGKVIADRYMTPYTAMTASGIVSIYQSAQELAEYFQCILDDYYAKGCRSCRYRDLQAFHIDNQNMLATVTWELMGENAQLISQWRESYNIFLSAENMFVFTSIDHAVE